MAEERSWAGPSEEDPTYRLLVDCNQLAVDIDNEIAIVHVFMRDKYKCVLCPCHACQDEEALDRIDKCYPVLLHAHEREHEKLGVHNCVHCAGQSSLSWRAWCTTQLTTPAWSKP